MVGVTRANASSTASNVEVVMGTTSKTPVFSANQGNDWTIWELKFSAYILGVTGFLSATQIAETDEKVIQQLWFTYY
jgi:hypothetical protein